MKLLKYLPLMAVCALVLSFSSCQDDEDVYNNLLTGVWTGDLGFNYGNQPVISELYFISNGQGYDKQYYFDDPLDVPPVIKLDFDWDINYGTLTLDYFYQNGTYYPLLQIRGVYISGNELTGTLYVDSKLDGPIKLIRQY